MLFPLADSLDYVYEERKDYLHWLLHARGLMETGLTALESSCTNGMKRTIDQTLDVPTGRRWSCCQEYDENAPACSRGCHVSYDGFTLY
ncbi:hypothetical protein REPUB_Repub12eG0216600 [Reevesia pubescens]